MKGMRNAERGRCQEDGDIDGCLPLSRSHGLGSTPQSHLRQQRYGRMQEPVKFDELSQGKPFIPKLSTMCLPDS